MGRKQCTKRRSRRIRGGKPKRSRSSMPMEAIKVRKQLIIGTDSGKRRRVDPGYPTELAKLTRNWSSGGFHSYRIDELNILLDQVRDLDLKDIGVDLGDSPVMAALKAGWGFSSNIAPTLDMGVAGRFTELVGVTLASTGSAMIRLSVDRLRDVSRSAAGATAGAAASAAADAIAAADAEPEELSFLRSKLSRGVDILSMGYNYINRHIPANLLTMQPLTQSNIKSHNVAWDKFKETMIILHNPAARMTDEDKMTRLQQLEDIVGQFNERYGQTTGSRDEQKLRFETWSKLVTEINELKVKLKIPLHKSTEYEWVQGERARRGGLKKTKKKKPSKKKK